MPEAAPAGNGTFHTPCDSCGADLRFAPGQTRLVCDHCGHVQEIAPPSAKAIATGIRELDLAAGLRADLPAGTEIEHRSARCPNCGALVEFPGEMQASQCPFCATPVVLDQRPTRAIRPQGLIPFAIAETAARDALGRWLAGRWFAPSGLAEYARKGRRMQGIYTPFWTFDADTASRYRGARGDWYYTTRQVRVNGQTRTEQVRHTRWTAVSGQVARRFDDIVILASRSLPETHTDALQPWDMTALVPYREDYLAGFLAEGYTVPLDEGHREAREIMQAQIARDVRQDIGGDEQRIEGIDSRFADETFKHLLLPVWTAAYKYGGRSYRFVVNGQTGKVTGERPWSAWKIAAAVCAALIAAAIVAYLNQYR